MSRMRKCLTGAGLVVAVLGLAGCPATPSIFVTPHALHFGTDDNLKSIRIDNVGGGTLTWTITESISWLTVRQRDGDKQASSLQGTVTTEIDVIELVLDRSGLNLGTSTGQILIQSNGGTITVGVSATEAAPAQLQVAPVELEFGISGQELSFNISNGGIEQLNWSLSVSGDAPWLTALPVQGSVDRGTPRTVTVTVDRAGLGEGPQTGTISITSNGGDATVIARMDVLPFVASPAQIDFGGLSAPQSQSITVDNSSGQPFAISFQASTISGGDWLSVNPAGGTLEVSGPLLQALVTANPAGLPPGPYSGQLRVVADASGFDQIIPVSMEVTGFEVDTTLIDFGTITSQTSDTFSILNLSSGVLAWSITVPATDAPWLSVSPELGLVQTEDLVTVTVDPLAVDPGPFESTLTITFPGGVATVTVRMNRPTPAELKVEPSNIDFGVSRSEELLGIWNAGIGTITWQIDTSGFPVWMSLSRLDEDGAPLPFQDDVEGAQTHTVTLSIDRDLVDPDTEPDFPSIKGEFTVLASGATTTPVTVRVRASVPLIPEIVLEADGVDDTGVAFVYVPVREEDRTLRIGNTGNGTLFWSIAADALPAWIASITPSQGSLDPGFSQGVTITVDRSGLDFTGAQATLTLTTNDPARETLPLLVEVQVPKRILIGARPTTLGFGLDASVLVVDVANFGDEGEMLQFQVLPTKDWVSVSPEVGQSIGVPLGLPPDFVAIAVTIERSLLDAGGAAAKLIVEAYILKDGERVRDESIEPVEITVSAEAAELTIETGVPRLRTPSLVRSVLLLRNIAQQSIPVSSLAGSELEDMARKITIFENDEPIPLNETNLFLSSADPLRTNVLIMMDHSGSMLESALGLVERGELVVAPDEDPVIALYQQRVSLLIDEMPDHYRIGLALFNEQAQQAPDGSFPGLVRVIRDSVSDPIFTDKAEARDARLQSISVTDHGATQLLPALNDAAAILLQDDLVGNRVPFDDADVRALICITDAAATTTPVGFTIQDTIDTLKGAGVRFFPIGWGNRVRKSILISIAEASGGHHYATRNLDLETGLFSDKGVPLLSELEKWCFADPEDPCSQSIGKDLKSQVMLSYVTLNQEATVTLRVDLSEWDDKTDQASPCIAEQGLLSANVERDRLPYADIVGDVRLGQISLRTDGIDPDNQRAIVTVRAEYIPRNVDRLALEILVAGAPPAAPPLVVPVPPVRGGLIADWEESREGITNAGGVYRYGLKLDGSSTPMRYGAFGDLLDITISGVTQPFEVTVRVLEPVIDVNDPDSKYFTAPDRLLIGAEESFAPAFPTMELELNGTPVAPNSFPVIDLGQNIDELIVGITNAGGSHPGTFKGPVGLLWEALPDSDGARFMTFPQFTPDLPLGFQTSSFDPSFGDTFDLQVVVNRCLAPGLYDGKLVVRSNSVTIRGFDPLAFVNMIPITMTDTIMVFYEVTPPILAVTPAQLQFPDAGGEFDDPITITNDGQSILSWRFDLASIKPWISVSELSGSLCAGESDTVLISVRTTELTPRAEPYTANIEVLADEGTEFEDSVTVGVSLLFQP